MVDRRSKLIEEGASAVGGTWNLMLGRPDALSRFDFSQRGLAGSFIALIVAFVVFTAITGMGAAARQTMSPAGQLFIIGTLIAARFVALRVVLPRLDALHGFRPVMVASNWVNAIAVGGLVGVTFCVAFAGVAIILTLWAAIAIATFIAEINILRIIAGLRGSEVVMVLAAQLFALILAIFILAQLPLG